MNPLKEQWMVLKYTHILIISFTHQKSSKVHAVAEKAERNRICPSVLCELSPAERYSASEREVCTSPSAPLLFLYTEWWKSICMRGETTEAGEHHWAGGQRFICVSIRYQFLTQCVRNRRLFFSFSFSFSLCFGCCFFEPARCLQVDTKW